MTKKTIYQLDYVDKKGLANYIGTYSKRQFKKATDDVKFLNRVNACISADTYYVLDEYLVDTNDEDYAEIIRYNITKAESVDMHISKVKEEMKNEKVNTTRL